MRIGIDIDGVLNNFEKYMDKIICNKYGYTVINQKGNNFDTRFGISIEEANKLWDEVREDYLLNFPPRRFCKSVLIKLKQEHEIILISNRGYGINSSVTADYILQKTLQWLKKYNLPYDKIYFVNGSKKPISLEEKIDLFIDDSLGVLRDLKTEIPVICFLASYNQHEKANFTYVKNWNDLYKKVALLKK
jgi:uncharacterized HAD superfamily protein